MVPGGYQILKEAIETVEKNYQMTRNTEEMGPQFSAVLILFQQDEVGAPIIFLQLEAAGKEHFIEWPLIPPPFPLAFFYNHNILFRLNKTVLQF